MRVVEGLGDGGGDDLVDGHAGRIALPQQLPGIGAVDVLGGDPHLAVGVAAVEHRDDVRVIEGGYRVRFADEPLPKDSSVEISGRSTFSASAKPSPTFNATPLPPIPVRL